MTIILLNTVYCLPSLYCEHSAGTLYWNESDHCSNIRAETTEYNLLLIDVHR